MSQPSSEAYPLSAQQKRVWNSLGHSGFVQASISLQGFLDVPRLTTALNSMVRRHEILRTTFRFSSGVKVPFQVVNPAVGLEIQRIDLRGATRDHQCLQLDHLLANLTQVDLERIPSLNAILVQLGEDLHALLVSLPALCADASTIGILVLELSRLYAGDDPAEPLQYADYSAWQQEALEREDDEATAAKSYWTQQDYAAIPTPVLPFEKRPSGNARVGLESVSVALHSETLARLSATGLGLSNCLLSAWQILIWRLTNQTELVIGRIADGRNHEEFGSSLGPFAGIVPEYLNFEQEEFSFADIARRAEQSRAAAVAHEDFLPFDRATSRGGVGYRADQVPDPQTAAGVTFAVQDLRAALYDFKLALECGLASDSSVARLSYDPGYFPRSVVERLAERLLLLLSDAARNSNAPAAALSIMDEGEREQLLAAFNQTAASFPRECVQQLFESQAARVPDRPALRFGDRVLTYAELNAGANRLAHVLRARGVARNIPVGLLLDRSAEMILGLLAILKAGGCYVPLLPDSPKARLAKLLSETGAAVVITQQNFTAALSDFQGAVICLDRDHDLLDSASDSNPSSVWSPDDLVYIIYTSGSTGVPKGVAVKQSNLANYNRYICGRLALDRDPVGFHFATVSTIAADLGNTSIFPALTTGGCLHVIDYQTSLNATAFAAYVAKYPIDVLKITPSHLGALLDDAGAAILPRKYLVLGGEALSWKLLERVQGSGGRCVVINHYGPTEATVGCCTFTPAENDVSAWTPATVPIGKPIANDRVFVLDSKMRPVPIGVPGELCVAGAGLAQGYFHQPDQTAQRFIPDPFSPDPTAQLYRTGDLARFLPDGNVEFLGRIDQQVKIRGFRVEPAEIIAALKDHPKIKQAVVVAREQGSRDLGLVAYFAPAGLVSESELRVFLQARLPDYMIPGKFIGLDSLPLTANGKVDLRSLARLEETLAEVVRPLVAPRNPDEVALTAIWKEVLRQESIGVTDNFFELGGHSLLATQIISRIRNTFHVQLSLPSFLQSPTIADVAAKLPDCPQVESEEEELAKLLAEIEGLSEEEAQQLLAGKLETEPGPASS